MTRPTLAGLAAGTLALAATGCLGDFLGRDSADIRGKAVETPTVGEASVAVAARVDQVGRELVGAVPFFPVDPTFHTVALPDPLVTHPDAHGVLVSEGLVKRCRSDAELAAVLASELGKMAAEKRLADRLRQRDKTPDAAPDDARDTAVSLLVAAGHSAKDLDAVAPLLKDADANRKLAGGLDPRPAQPRWSP